GPRTYPISAVYHDTPGEPLGPAVLPGTYTIKLTAGGRSFAQPLVVKMDPRVATPAAGLAEQFQLSMRCYDGTREARSAVAAVRALRKQLGELKAKAGPAADTLAAGDATAAALDGAA